MTDNFKKRINILGKLIETVRGFDIEKQYHQLSSSIDVLGEHSSDRYRGIKVKGIAMRPGIWKNFEDMSVKYERDEIMKSVPNLIGKPLYIEHRRFEKKSAVGIITNAWYDEFEEALRYEAIITDAEYALRIAHGEFKHVSVGAWSNRILTDHDYTIGRNIRYNELSLVQNPGVAGASVDLIV